MQVIPEYILDSSAVLGTSVWEGEVLTSAFSLLTKRWTGQVKGQLLLSLDALSRKTHSLSRKNVHSASSAWAQSCQFWKHWLLCPLGWTGQVCGCQGKEEGQQPGLCDCSDQQVPPDGPSAPSERRFGCGSGLGAPCATCCDDTCLEGCGDRTKNCRSPSGHAVGAVLPLISSQCPCPCLPHGCSAVPCSYI